MDRVKGMNTVVRVYLWGGQLIEKIGDQSELIGLAPHDRSSREVNSRLTVLSIVIQNSYMTSVVCNKQTFNALR